MPEIWRRLAHQSRTLWMLKVGTAATDDSRLPHASALVPAQPDSSSHAAHGSLLIVSFPPCPQAKASGFICGAFTPLQWLAAQSRGHTADG